MSDGGSCEVCGQNFKKRDFSTDWLGRVVLDGHRCDPRQVARFQQEHPRYQQREQVRSASCHRCGRYYQRGNALQLWCSDCKPIVRKEQDAERHARQRDVA